MWLKRWEYLHYLLAGWGFTGVPTLNTCILYILSYCIRQLKLEPPLSHSLATGPCTCTKPKLVLC